MSDHCRSAVFEEEQEEVLIQGMKKRNPKSLQIKLNTSYLTDSYIVFTLKIESVPKTTIFGLKMMVKSGLGKIFFKFLHAHTMSFLLLNLYFWSKLSNKNDMVSAWRNFKNIFPRPLFIIIFRPEILKFHPYSILTGDTRVEFVIYCVLIKSDHNYNSVLHNFSLLFSWCQPRLAWKAAMKAMKNYSNKIYAKH